MSAKPVESVGVVLRDLEVIVDWLLLIDKTPNWANVLRDAMKILLNKVNDEFTSLKLDESNPVVIDRITFESIRSSTQTEFQIICDINEINTESRASVIGLCSIFSEFHIIPERFGRSFITLFDLWRQSWRPTLRPNSDDADD
jgi:hypothetical protein